MFKLFKSERQVIQEIHDEFDTAEDRLLQQADSLLKELNIPTQSGIEKKAERLINLGFVNSEVATKSKSLKESADKIKIKIVSTREQAELIRYYKQNYPFQKFLTESELERICKKYNLVFAPVSNYTKDVPEKNICEIEKSPILNTKDTVGIEYLFRAHNQNIKKGCPAHIKKALLSGIKLRRNHSWEIENSIKEIYNTDYTDCIKYTSFDHDIITVDKSGLFIAAPQSHFNLNGLTKKGKYSFMNVTITEVKDPIVFRYVRGGVQVLSKWGLEASDELLVNEINN